MNDSAKAAPLAQPPFNLYKAVGLLALLLLTMALLEKQMALWSFLPACFGLLGILGGWRSAPCLLLLALAAGIPVRAAGFVPRSFDDLREFTERVTQRNLAFLQRNDPVPDFLACAAVLAFL